MKIHIIGGPGSGKSYAAKKLSKKLNIRKFDLDYLFWDNDGRHFNKKNTPENRDKELARILKLDSWIIEGVYYKWLSESFKLSDKIIILKPNVYLRDFRIIKRFLFRKMKIIKSKKKETLKGLIELLIWNHEYDNDNLKRAYVLINIYKEKVIELNKADEIIKILKEKNI